MTDIRGAYARKRVMVTGGLGMIGSAIALRLVDFGADVTLVDARLEPYGANDFNVATIRGAVRIEHVDIRDRTAMDRLVQNKDVIFNLAGQVSHNDSLQDPFLDADINHKGHLTVLESVRQNCPEAVVLHAGSRLQYGRIEKIPVAEEHALRPRTPYALNKTAAENMYRFYNEVHGVACVMLRIANPYGPRSQMKHSKYSMVNWFIRQAMDGHAIEVFGAGEQLRDYVFVDDVANAFIAAAVTTSCWGEVFNIGSGHGTRFRDMAEMVVATVGQGEVATVPWPQDYIHVETGGYVADIRKLRSHTDWAPETDLQEGVRRTCAYYKEHRPHYW